MSLRCFATPDWPCFSSSRPGSNPPLRAGFVSRPTGGFGSPLRPGLGADELCRSQPSWASIAATTVASSGSVRGSKRATTVPAGEIKNFSKFHRMSPV